MIYYNIVMIVKIVFIVSIVISVLCATLFQTNEQQTSTHRSTKLL